jgi:hypothetical protein
LIDGQYKNPVRIVAFNTSQGWSRDLSAEIAAQIKERSERKSEELSPGLSEWIEWQLEMAESVR